MNPDYINHIKKAFEVGRDSEEIVAYHGTSLEVLREIINAGIQIGSIFESNNSLKIRKGDVFFYPIKEKSKIEGELGAYDEKMAFYHASIAASRISEHSYILTRLGLPFDTHLSWMPNEMQGDSYWWGDFASNTYFTEGEDYKEIMKYLSKVKGFSNEYIDNIVREARKEKGVVIGYKKSIFDRGEPLQGDDDYDIRVLGVKIEDIIGIEPLDQESWDFLSSL